MCRTDTILDWSMGSTDKKITKPSSNKTKKKPAYSSLQNSTDDLRTPEFNHNSSRLHPVRKILYNI